MSLLSEYMKKEQLLKQIQEEMEQMEGDQRLKSEIEFKERLEALMQEFGKSAADVIDLLQPKEQSANATKNVATGGVRRKRKLKIYKNPHTGEVVETRGGNQKTLKTWKDEHGAETVESWLVRTEG